MARPGPSARLERRIREDLAREIVALTVGTGMSQQAAAGLLGATQANVSALGAGKVDGFSLERLVGYLNALGQDVHVVVLPAKPARQAKTEVRRAAASFASSGAGWTYA